MKLKEIADKLECRLEGDGELEIEGIATLEAARPGQISFLTNIKYAAAARGTSASALIVGADCPEIYKPLLKHPNPYLAFAKAIELFFDFHSPAPMIHPTAWISNRTSVGKGASIGAYSFIADSAVIEDGAWVGPHCAIYAGARIGEGAIIHSGCAIREDVSIGKRCVIHNNSVIGADGFGYARTDGRQWYKIHQTGTVVVEDDVEIGAGVTIDRAALGETRIGRGTKIDNLVHIGHGCMIGSDSLICAQVGLSGSTQVGNRVILAGQVGSAGHLTIGDDAIVTAQSGLPASVEPGKVVSGSPALDHKLWLKSSAMAGRLPDLQKTVKALERRLERLEQKVKVTDEI
jgi:UDP-3-O-[3-hydroxymyristoyl] glucosamine N-acyltransferase